MGVVPRVLYQHAQEAAALWIMRRAMLRAPQGRLSELARLDERLEAHLDGLRIAGEQGWNQCQEQLAANEPAEVFAAGALAASTADPSLMARVLSVAEKDVKLAGALAGALGWTRFEQVQSQTQALVQSPNPMHQWIAIATAALQRRHPGPPLLQAARSEDVRLKSRALKAAGELADDSLVRELVNGFRHDNPQVRFAAAWSGVLTGLPAAVQVLCDIAESGGRRGRQAAELVARRMDLAAVVSWHTRVASNPRSLRLAVILSGAAGAPSFVPALLSAMEQLALARLAGESFSLITGVDLAFQKLDRTPPANFQSGPTEDPSDENVEMDPDDNLPWPDPALVQKWWDKNRGQFQNGTRYLLGKPITPEWLTTVLRDGRQGQRAAAALELAIRNPGQPLFNVKAPGFRQIELLGKPGPAIR